MKQVEIFCGSFDVVDVDYTDRDGVEENRRSLQEVYHL